MKMNKGLSFALGGNKRPAPAQAPPKAKKPATVNDLFSPDSDEEDEQPVNAKNQGATPTVCVAVCPPADVKVREAADKLAEFVAKNGRSFEEITKQRNPGETPFKFLQEPFSADYKYYLAKIQEFEKLISNNQVASASSSSRVSAVPAYSRSAPEEPEKMAAKAAVAVGNSLAAMEAYMKLAAKKERGGVSSDDDEDGSKAPPLLNDNPFERRKVVAVFKDDGSRGHHMQDFIPKEELTKFLAKTGDVRAAAEAKALEQKNAISADNIGHKLLQKMGWREGEGIGAAGTGITAPVQATGARDNLGIGAAAHGEVSADDDPFEQYRKRMMLGYKFRPNPLGNPRKPYY